MNLSEVSVSPFPHHAVIPILALAEFEHFLSNWRPDRLRSLDGHYPIKGPNYPVILIGQTPIGGFVCLEQAFRYLVRRHGCHLAFTQMLHSAKFAPDNARESVSTSDQTLSVT